jgi:putative hydrolase of the HAD superfamily
VRRALIFDLFSTLIPGGHAERAAVHREMARIMDVDPEALSRAFDDTLYERFSGGYGDLTSTLRAMASRCGADPSDDQLRAAAELRSKLARQLLGDAPAGTLDALATLRSAGWRTGLVSNITSETMQQWPTSALAQHFDTTAFSSEVGAGDLPRGLQRARRHTRRMRLHRRRKRQRAAGGSRPRHACHSHDRALRQ